MSDLRTMPAPLFKAHQQLDKTVRYIHRQPEHHRKMTFEEEFLALLRKHRIAWDERYRWEWRSPSLLDLKCLRISYAPLQTLRDANRTRWFGENVTTPLTPFLDACSCSAFRFGPDGSEGAVVGNTATADLNHAKTRNPLPASEFDGPCLGCEYLLGINGSSLRQIKRAAMIRFRLAH